MLISSSHPPKIAPSGGSGADCMQIWHLYLECPAEPPARSCNNASVTMHPWLVISCLNATLNATKSPGEILDCSGSFDTLFHDISEYILDHLLILLIIHRCEAIKCYVSECNLYHVTIRNIPPPLLPQRCAPSALANRLHDSRWHPSPSIKNGRLM